MGRGAPVTGGQLGRWVMSVALAAAVGCIPKTAVVDGVSVPRSTMRFVGQPFFVDHVGAHPRPGGPSGGLVADGGWISGEVCAHSVGYYIEHRGDHVLVEGFGGGASRMEVRDVGGGRSISGGSVELWMGSDGILGSFDRRPLFLARNGDRLTGLLGPRPVVVNGRNELSRMPAAAQAVVLTALLRCGRGPARPRVLDTLEVGFGEPQTMTGSWF